METLTLNRVVRTEGVTLQVDYSNLQTFITEIFGNKIVFIIILNIK